MEKRRIRGGGLLARAFKEKGVDHVFTLAGGFCNPALEGFMQCQMPVINCPHEQVAGHLADGHARITRKPTVCLVGPEGFANAVPAMMEAWGERSPVIFVTGSSDAQTTGSRRLQRDRRRRDRRAPDQIFSAKVTDGDTHWRVCRSGLENRYQSGYPGSCAFEPARRHHVFIVR